MSTMSSHFIQTPRSRQDASRLQLNDMSHLPIVYPSSAPSSRVQSGAERSPALEREHGHGQGQSASRIHEQYEDEDEWVPEVDANATDAKFFGRYGGPVRPQVEHRESQDVVFGNRLTSMGSLRGRGRPWDVNVRLPHMPKQLSRGKTALMRSLRGGLRKVQHVHHAHSVSGGSRSGHGGSPSFEFRDPQPAPQSIRQQYAELAPPEPQPESKDESQSNTTTTTDIAPAGQSEMRTHHGLLAPPAPSDPRASLTVPDSDVTSRRHSRRHSLTGSGSGSVHTLRPRSRSAGSRRSHRSFASADTTAVQHSRHAHDDDDDEGEDDGANTAETTLVQHVNDLTLTPIHLSPSQSSAEPSSKRSHFSLLPTRQRYSRSYSYVPGSAHDLRLPRPRTVLRSSYRYYAKKQKNSLIRAIKAFHRLPWMATAQFPPGALIPADGSPPRIAKDFIPTLSERAKLRNNATPSMGLVYKKKGVRSDELEAPSPDIVEADGVEKRSWYQPRRNASAKEVQRAVRAQHYQQEQRRIRMLGLGGTGGALGLGLTGNSVARPVKQAYASYRAASSASGRPLDYMYAAPSVSGSATSRRSRMTPRSMPVSRAASAQAPSPSLYSQSYSYYGYPREGSGSVALVNAALYGVDGSPGSIAAAASAYLTRSASASAASGSQGSSLGTPRRRISTGAPAASLEYAGSTATSVPPPVPPKTSEHGHGHRHGHGHERSYSQSQPVAYYTYNYAYPQAQPQSYRYRVPGSSPPLPPLPPASAGTGTSGAGAGASYRSVGGDIAYASAPSPGHGHPVQVTRSASASEKGSIPTIPSTIAPSQSSSGSSSHSYTRQGHGYGAYGNGHASGDHGSSGSNGTVRNGYGTALPVYAYGYARA